VTEPERRACTEHHVPDGFGSGSPHTIGESLTFDVRLGPDERRGPATDDAPHEVKDGSRRCWSSCTPRVG